MKSSTSNKNIESLSSLLEKLKIEKIGEKLEAEDIDLESLIMLKEDDLKVFIRIFPRASSLEVSYVRDTKVQGPL